VTREQLLAPGRGVHLKLDLDPFDEGYDDDETSPDLMPIGTLPHGPDDELTSAYVELDAEEPTIQCCPPPPPAWRAPAPSTRRLSP
jgi:hypothetical protein